MDVQEMLEREDLIDILEKTVRHYYNDINGEKINISRKVQKNGVPIYLMARPGIYATYPISKDAKKTIITEYSLRGNMFRYLLAKEYVILRCKLMKLYAISCSYTDAEGGNLLKNVLIVPNNKSIRIFDYRTDTVYSVVKFGFSNKYMRRQIEFRNKYKYEFVLPVIDFGEDWFKEKILKGHSLARVRNNKDYVDSATKAIEYIKQLFRETSRVITAREYIARLKSQIFQILDGFTLEYKHKELFLNTLNCFDQYVEKYKNTPINIGLTHGDFQTGNIWRDDLGKTLIYDWETVDERSEWYDLAVMFAGLRKRQNYDNFWKKPFTAQLRPEYPELAKTIIIFEDIVFHLEEIASFCGELRSNLLQNYEMEKISTLEGAMRNG